jgi:hypothetical protein
MKYRVAAKAGRKHKVSETVGSIRELNNWLSLYRSNGYTITNVSRVRGMVR